MSNVNDDTILPPKRRRITSSGTSGDTVFPSRNISEIHVAGDVIDNRYTVIREIGRGGMGVVYEVEDQISNNRYAIKRLLPESAANEQVVRAFVREGTAAEGFSAKSKYFVTTKSIGLDDNGYYVLMELVTNVTLRYVLSSKTQIEVQKGTEILDDLAMALADLHSSGHIHGDLKPENIFVNLTGTSPVVQLVDFGLTRDISSQTITGLGGGTMKYMAPEQLRDDTATTATDMYSFGLIAFELLTGEFPGIGESLADYIVHIDTLYSGIVMKCLSKRPDRRPQNGQALLKLLDVGFSNQSTSQLVGGNQNLVRSTLSFPNLQDGTTVTVDGRLLRLGQDYECEIKPNKSATFEVQVTWEGFDLFRGPLTLKSGEHRRVEVPRGYRVDCEVPSWCQVTDADNRPVTFPYIHCSIARPIERTYCLVHNDYIFGSLDVDFKSYVSKVDIPYKLASVIVDRSVEFDATRITKLDGQVLCSSSSTQFTYMIPIKLGETMGVVVQCFDKFNTESFRKIIQLQPGNELIVKVPEREHEEYRMIQNQIVKLDEFTRTWNIKTLTEQPTSRRVLIGAGVGAAVASAWYSAYYIKGTVQESSKIPIRTRDHEEQALIHDKMVEAAVKCQGRFPELSKYLRMMRVIPAGTFIQGSDARRKSSSSDEWPAHSVTLSAFGLGETPVSVAVWKEYCSTGFGGFPEVKRWRWSRVHPIVNISWDEIMGPDGKNGFCAWASEVSGLQLTLPTEAQFEYAARGGQYSLRFPWGNEYDDSKLWCSVISKKSLTAPINRNTHVYRNGYGLTDMVGNVWQWCFDYYSPYSRDATSNPTGPSYLKDGQRCMRGGSWVSEDMHVFMPTDRLPKSADTKYSGCGFRLATNLS